jgi:hypothetical protein
MFDADPPVTRASTFCTDVGPLNVATSPRSRLRVEKL